MSYLYNSNVSIEDIVNGNVFFSPIDLQPMNFNSRTNSPGYDRYVVTKMELYKYYKSFSSMQRKYRRWMIRRSQLKYKVAWASTKWCRAEMNHDQCMYSHRFLLDELDAFEEEISLLYKIDDEERDHMRALREGAGVSGTAFSKGQVDGTLADKSTPVKEAVPVGRVKTRYVAGQRFSKAKITVRVSGAPLRRVGFIAPRSPGVVLGSKRPGGGMTSLVQMEVEDISNLDGLVQETCVAVEQSVPVPITMSCVAPTTVVPTEVAELATVMSVSYASTQLG